MKLSTIPCFIAFISFKPIDAFVTSVTTTNVRSTAKNTVDLAATVQDAGDSTLDPAICSQFTIQTCSATSCARRRKSFGLGSFATFEALWAAKEEAGASPVTVEECSCLGNCKRGPNVAIQHEDFLGRVGLEGMTDVEFQSNTFQRVVTQDDVDRVWGSVENAIRIFMAEEEEEEV